MAQSSEEPLDATGWKDLFMKHGIKEVSATEYGTKFLAEEMTVDMIPRLDRTILKEMGVKVIGDALAILSISDTCVSASSPAVVKAPAAKLSQISYLNRVCENSYMLSKILEFVLF